jgi:hypothetical protein
LQKKAPLLSTGTDKEFSAASGSFLAWVSGDEDSRLVTTSRTRQQQASRAFGAELLAPVKYLEKRLGKEKDVSTFTLDKVSEDIGVASTIVRLQAQNHGYRLLEARSGLVVPQEFPQPFQSSQFLRSVSAAARFALSAQ